jgi:hypothetical protein
VEVEKVHGFESEPKNEAHACYAMLYEQIDPFVKAASTSLASIAVKNQP